MTDPITYLQVTSHQDPWAHDTWPRDRQRDRERNRERVHETQGAHETQGMHEHERSEQMKKHIYRL